MSTIYKTQEWDGFVKNTHYWNEYRLDGDTVSKFKCYRIKTFDSDGSYWATGEDLEESWQIGDPAMPEWLNQHI